MKIILIEDVKKLGKKGDIVNVSDGYARNMLIPKNLGIEATAGNLNTLKLKKAHEDRVAAQTLASAEELGKKLDGSSVKIAIKAGDNGKVFGSVSAKEIADAVREQLGEEIDRKKIVMDGAIRTLGETQVRIKLHPKVSVLLNVNVTGI